MRNPFRFTARPGPTNCGSATWAGTTWEEINRVLDPSDDAVENFGWPCYEGNGRQSGYDGANLSICENLYAKPEP